MSLRSEIATLFARHAFALTNSTDFQALESGQAAPEDYTRFIGNVVRTHLKLPPLRAFLFTLAPPDITAHLLHSKLEEPGTPEDEASPTPPCSSGLPQAQGSRFGCQNSRPWRQPTSAR